MAACSAHLDRLTKPPGSLGRLETLAIQLAGISGRPDAPVAARAIVVAAADHGVARRGVSAYPAEVTAQMVANFVAGGAAINVLAGAVDARVVVVDAGVAGPIPAVEPDLSRGGRLVSARVRPGTADMTEGPAMTRDEALRAIATGRRSSPSCVPTRPASTCSASARWGSATRRRRARWRRCSPGAPVDAVTGRGTGIDDAGRERKIAAIETALARERPDPDDPLGVLAAVGGLEIAVLVGVLVEAALAGIPVVLDGFISTSAALVAVALEPRLGPRLIAGHRSTEPGHRIVLDHLGLTPILELDLRLGEASGAALAMGVIVAAVAIRDEMATFDSAGIDGPA